MQTEDFKWLIIRTIGLVLLCGSVYYFYHLVLSILSLLPADGHCYGDYGYSERCGEEAVEPIYGKIWLTLKELFVLGGMSYYFLKDGTAAFKFLSNKENLND